MHQRKSLPSVTEILQAAHLGVDLGIPDGKLEYVLRRGTALHSAIELDLAGDLDAASVHEDIAPRLDAFRKFAKDVNLKPIATEIELTNHEWRVLGHPDLVATMNGRPQRVLVDWKSSPLDRFAARYQLAAYRWLWDTTYPADQIDECVVVHLRDDGTAWPHAIDTTGALHVFQAAVVCWWARKERE